MSVLATYTKQPVERKDYDVDYADWLQYDPGDTLDSVDHAVTLLAGSEADPLVVERIDITANTAKVWVLGGAAGARYKVELTVTTQRGRIDQSELVFKVKDY